MRSDPRAVELIYEGTHFNRTQQKFVGYILRIQIDLCALRIRDHFGQLGGKAIPSLLRADLEFRAVPQTDGIEQQSTAVQVSRDGESLPNRVGTARSHGRIGGIERILVQ